MTRDSLDHEIADVEQKVIEMGHMVEDVITRSIHAFIERNESAAQGIIEGDYSINEMQRLIRSKTFSVMARQQPVARDLRTLVTVQLVASELERMADHAATIAKQCGRIDGAPALKPEESLVQMADMVGSQVRDSIQSFIKVDENLAREICSRDDGIDELYHTLISEMLRIMATHPDQVTHAAAIIFAAHDLERIGDRATNICEDVIYLSTGEIIELN